MNRLQKTVAAVLFAVAYAAYADHLTHGLRIAYITGQPRVAVYCLTHAPTAIYRDLFPSRQEPWNVLNVMEVTGKPRHVVEAAFAKLEASDMTDSDIAEFEDAVNLPEEDRL